MHPIIAIPAAVVEISVLCLGAFAVFRRWEYTFAESASYAIITTLMALSFMFQAAFIVGVPGLSIKAEVVLCLLSAIAVACLSPHIGMSGRIIRNFVSEYPGAIAAMLIAWGILAARAMFFPPAETHWDSVAQMSLFQQYGTFFFTLPEPTAGNPPLFPVNTVVLPYLLLRMHTSVGVGIFGFLAYLSIGFSTYALSRRYSWPPTAFTVTMIVMSMPRLVCLSASPGNEIVPAAVAVFCLLAINRTLEQPNIRDLTLLFLGILFSISGQVMCLVFPLILVSLSCVLLIRRHGKTIWWAIINARWWAALLTIPVALVFSQGWLFLYNAVYRETWMGSPPDFIRNPDGLTGAVGNFVRYILESAHFTHPLDVLCNWMLNFRLTGMLHRIYGMFADSFFGDLGTASPFVIQWVPDAALSWFGPFAFLLVLPALLYSLVRGHRRLKAIAIALTGYFYIVTLIAAWVPGNARFFTVFYACGGFFIGSLLPPWRFTNRGKHAIQLASAFLLFYTCAYNIFV
ncbi:hypothetical protein QUF80_17395 [Desulfococcaceae bacterium HSG8]|nr:hypothetical protein [Desulfococcaceae bacterium HSG8]